MAKKNKEAAAPAEAIEAVETGGLGIDEGIVITTFLVLIAAITLIYFAVETYK
ncbi:MAG: hypothetical protein IPK26_12745 [Planctomycetes bacterium]|nr:hypothetical protein [Planctomycetota bacterium]